MTFLANFYSTLLGYLPISPVHFNANFSRLVSSAALSNTFQATMKIDTIVQTKTPENTVHPVKWLELEQSEKEVTLLQHNSEQHVVGKCGYVSTRAVLETKLLKSHYFFKQLHMSHHMQVVLSNF